MFHTFEKRVVIKAKLEAVTPLHVGAPEQAINPVSVDNQVCKDALGRPFIPGSSLKGVLRSFTERVLRSGFGNRLSKREVCSPTDHLCLDHSKDKERLAQIKGMNTGKPYRLAELLYEESCDICRIYGGANFASKISVCDLTVDQDTWLGKYDTRNGVGIDRDSGTKKNGVLYDFEAVPAGTRFHFELVIDNPTESELHNALIGVRALQEGHLLMGGKTSRGLGKVRLVEDYIYEINSESLGHYLVNSATFPVQRIADFKVGDN